MDLTQKYHVFYFPDLKVTLKRFYVYNADEVGTAQHWKRLLDQLYAQMPFPDLFKDFTLEIWNMACPDLLNAGKVTLLDYDLNTPGKQTAAGLYTGNKTLAVGIFFPGWDSSSGAPTQFDVDNCDHVISHEFGHLYGDMSGLDKPPFNAYDIKGFITSTFKNLRPYQTQNIHEDWAEAYRALNGTDECRGTFSDGKSFAPSPYLETLISCAYQLNATLQDRYILSFKVYDGWCQWEEHEGLFWPFTYRRTYALTKNWEMFKWDGKWIRI